jgi:phosphoserine / homoserine phosphotransferase
MRQRLRILQEHQLGVPDIQKVISTMAPMPSAKEFLDWVRSEFQLVILSDTFYEFAMPLMRQLGSPTLMCHRLSTDANGFVNNYHLRQKDQKRMAVKAFHSLNYKVIAAGDSYNDTGMLSEADAGFFFCPPENIIAEFPQFKVVRDYDALKHVIAETEKGFQ